MLDVNAQNAPPVRIKENTEISEKFKVYKGHLQEKINKIQEDITNALTQKIQITRDQIQEYSQQPDMVPPNQQFRLA